MENRVVVQEAHISPLEKQTSLYYTIEIIDQMTQYVVHESARIWYVSQGSAIFYLNENQYELKTGMAVCIFPWDVTRIGDVYQEVEMHIIVYRFSAINAHIRLLEAHQVKSEPLFSRLKKQPIIYMDMQMSKSMMQLINQIGALQNQTSLYQQMEQESVFVQVVCRIAESKHVSKERKIQSDGALTLAIDIMQYMACHFGKKLTLDYVAQHFFTNRTTVAKALREVFSLTFVQMLSRMRLHKGLELLLTTSETIDDIAQTIGYFDGAHFTKQFECMYELSPMAYRKKHTGLETFPLVKIEEIIDYIRNHFHDEAIRAHQVAKYFSISTTTLNTWISFYTECSFDAWIHVLRMHYAARLLRTTNQPILDIAITVGYTNTRTFQRVFEQHFHTTPSQYRKI